MSYGPKFYADSKSVVKNEIFTLKSHQNHELWLSRDSKLRRAKTTRISKKMVLVECGHPYEILFSDEPAIRQLKMFENQILVSIRPKRFHLIWGVGRVKSLFESTCPWVLKSFLNRDHTVFSNTFNFDFVFCGSNCVNMRKRQHA